jgi:preprotein translocase subunit SecF
MQIVPPDTRINFVGQIPLWVAISTASVVASLGLIFARGLNLGLEFTGGTVLEVRAAGEQAVEEGVLRQALADTDYRDATITRVGEADARDFRISLGLSQSEDRDLSLKVEQALEKHLGTEIEMRRNESIGPRVSRELSRDALLAIVVAWVAILIYIWFRFDLRYAPGAVIALVHDTVVTAGVFSLFGWTFDLNVVAALLVIIGFSLNDTIVIYDRIRENLALRGKTLLADVINQSINQTLSRTILTSGTVLFAVLAMLLLGGPVLRGFSAALTIGVVIGTYSTIYVASATLLYLEKRFGGPGTGAAAAA